ncbi:brix domain-containing protein ZK795.3 [Anastrepha obliqua]|uniref:brix domain-containing protein ZK795.3 n=1 Tax=Anastrepha ludens TaxID=28586 RepID=UPI0023B0CE3B|nr:brix domain-containing protein ZK795.3 [Anastrepha ludens]XP_054743666.1 brix domain-containing protein ZK795.3 [Anastrepha obliqua]
MIRRQARLRREFLLEKAERSRIEKKTSKNKKLELLKGSVANNPLYSASTKQKQIKYGDVVEADDEYRYAGSYSPKIMITTSHDPSAKLKMFVKELRLIFPNAQRMNRGKNDLKQLTRVCCANDVTDIIVVHEHRGIPDNIVISHLPNGPTAFFNVSDVVMRHDVPFIGTMSEQNPHLIFHNFKSKVGERVTNILKHLFPTPKTDSKRVITFANHDDYISFRHHTYKYEKDGLELTEVGPRFQLKLYQIKLGKLDEIQASDTEWVLRPYLNTAVKNKVLSNESGWDGD